MKNVNVHTLQFSFVSCRENGTLEESVKAAAHCQLEREGVFSWSGLSATQHRLIPSRALCLAIVRSTRVFTHFYLLRGYASRQKPFMVLAEDFTMSRTDEVHRLTENVYKVRLN